MTENTCEGAPDLMAFIYHEMDERETREFRLHLQQCSSCREEAASLGIVRESIIAWRDEALAGFVSTQVTTKPRKSAIAALRQFFDLSPLWLKGATAFAMVAFFVLLGLAVVKLKTNNAPVISTNAKYTEQDVERKVKEALAQQEKPRETVAIVESPKPKKSKVSAPNQLAKSRRPLSRSEREQLAADLRLLSTSDDAGLYLLGDRINQ
ncbi:MAG TPA: zf-HC2 domain-containing protein [Pyrinomonadaceae bacterium]|nr:zf-HC2 domain-containing protein [Pyrinomonadaceae bacterium]